MTRIQKTAHTDRTDSLQQYFNEIKITPLLTFEEEMELSKQIAEGNEPAKERLIESNLRLVVKIAKQYVSPEMGLMDLVQEGNMGLIKAASKYDYHKKVRFSTYASWWIKQTITRALSNKRRSIRLPHRKEEIVKKVQKSFHILSQQLMRKPTEEELAREVGIEVDDLNDILNISGTILSLDGSADNDDSGSLMDVCEDERTRPEDELMESCLREDTRKVLTMLMDKEREILLHRFEFYGGKKYTLKSIGEKFGISPETVRQIEMRALKKLRDQAEPLRDYVS
ncbi:MAG: RNA polymerase sigma factor RpoD/SigA [Spirochaetales bacterium]|nr:RNA polymerase sigma factor RpoD/SigA [Spirochaetales bacterium]